MNDTETDGDCCTAKRQMTREEQREALIKEFTAKSLEQKIDYFFGCTLSGQDTAKQIYQELQSLRVKLTKMEFDFGRHQHATNGCPLIPVSPY